MSKAARFGASPRWWRWLVFVVLFFAAVPILEVAIVRFVDPPVTPLMLIRPLEARWEGRPPVSRQYTSMLTEIDIFAMTEPRYLKYFEDTCGAVVSDQVPLLGEHEYIRWLSDGHCERKKGWSR